MANWIEGKIAENIHWSENLFTLKITAAVDRFSAGQFTSLALDIEGERIARPYSFLSSPGQQPLEFFFYTANGGVLSNALVKLDVGDSVWVKQQGNGFFTLNEVPQCDDLWMMGTGTGVAPFFSILNTPEPWQRFKNIFLVHAVRKKTDLRYQNLIDKFKQEHPQSFTFQAFISREEVPDVIRGRIPAAISQGVLEEAVNRELTIEHSHIMLCGNPDMVNDCVAALKLRGFSKNRRRTPGHITVENYW